MKVIFTDQVAGVASKGDVKNVRPGFFRNFLLPYNKAIIATESLLKEWEERRKKMLIAKEQLKTKFEETKRRIQDATLKIEKKVTKKATLYGGVKAADIVKALQEQLALEIPENAIVLEKPLKTIGIHEIKLIFGEGIEGSVKVEIVEKKGKA